MIVGVYKLASELELLKLEMGKYVRLKITINNNLYLNLQLNKGQYIYLYGLGNQSVNIDTWANGSCCLRNSINTRHWPAVVLTLDQRLRRWSNVKTTEDQRSCLPVSGQPVVV